MFDIIKDLKKLETIDITGNLPAVRPLPIYTKQKSRFSIFKKINSLFTNRKWELADNYEIELNYYSLFVPKGFDLDFASVPRLLQSIIPPDGVLLTGSVFHDLGYKYEGLIIKFKDELYFKKFTKTEIDKIFQLIVEKVNDMVIVSTIAEKSVNIFGWFPWNSWRKENHSINEFNLKIKEI